PDDPIVWTGSTNWTYDQTHTDANNVIIFQDQSMARGYTLEFEEMWGSTGPSPNLGVSEFGKYKTDNTPHEYIVGGRRVESYFSPSDNTNLHIINTINTADKELYFAMFTFTKTDPASAIAGRVRDYGVKAAGIVDTSSSTNSAHDTLLPVLGYDLLKAFKE